MSKFIQTTLALSGVTHASFGAEIQHVIVDSESGDVYVKLLNAKDLVSSLGGSSAAPAATPTASASAGKGAKTAPSKKESKVKALESLKPLKEGDTVKAYIEDEWVDATFVRYSAETSVLSEEDPTEYNDVVISYDGEEMQFPANYITLAEEEEPEEEEEKPIKKAAGKTKTATTSGKAGKAAAPAKTEPAVLEDSAEEWAANLPVGTSISAFWTAFNTTYSGEVTANKKGKVTVEWEDGEVSALEEGHHSEVTIL